ncbi:MAG: DUF255 domain-containing protein [Bacteroidetes bacterium]|nr:DUF255 domain-containing protein [Bacteroidota bacterium]
MKTMMKSGIALLLFATICAAFKSATPADHRDKLEYFQGTFEQALKKAQQENKPIFMDAYTSWCGWCKELDKRTFSDQTLADYMNNHFINVKMDMESGEGEKLGSKYDVSAYPTLLFIHQNGRLAHRIEGFMQAPAMLEEVKFAEKKLERLDRIEQRDK